MKRFIVSLLLPAVLLAACGGGDDGEATCTQQYWDGQIGACLPDGWTVVSRETLDEHGLPEEVVAAFQAEKAVSGQFPTITVTREELQNPVSSPDYSAASIRSVTVLPEYKLADQRDLAIEGEDVQLHIFTARPLPEEPQRRFYQVSAVHENAGYTFTALTPLSVSNALEAQILTILGSASFTEPVQEEETEE